MPPKDHVGISWTHEKKSLKHSEGGKKTKRKSKKESYQIIARQSLYQKVTMLKVQHFLITMKKLEEARIATSLDDGIAIVIGRGAKANTRSFLDIASGRGRKRHQHHVASYSSPHKFIAKKNKYMSI